jgi:hypothetical protein
MHYEESNSPYYICIDINHNPMRSLLLAGILLFASTSHAEVIVRTVDLDLSNPQEEINVDLDKNGTVDFKLFYDVFEDEPFLHINVPTSLQSTNKIVVTGEHNTFGKDLVAKLPTGYGIYEGSEFNGQIFGNGPLMAQPDFAGDNILEGRGPSIVGFAFDRSGEIHYGWMVVELNQAGTRAQVSALAYEMVADRKILAGAVPMTVEQQVTHQSLRRLSDRLFEVVESATQIQVVDLLGREVLDQKFGNRLDLGGLGAGVYFVTSRSEGSEKVERIILH